MVLDAASSYMNVIRDGAIVQLQKYNVDMLQEQLSHTRQRLKVKEVTTTDVSQTQTRLAGARWSLLAAEAAFGNSRAAYRRVIGEEAGNKLAPASPVLRVALGLRDDRDLFFQDCQVGAWSDLRCGLVATLASRTRRRGSGCRPGRRPS